MSRGKSKRETEEDGGKEEGGEEGRRGGEAEKGELGRRMRQKQHP